HFIHFFAGFGTPAGRPEHASDQLNYAASNTTLAGYRYKRRISQHISLVTDWNVRRLAFHLKQWEKFDDPIFTTWDKRKLVIMQSGTGLYTRINYDTKRGNYIGRYIDLGGYLAWNINSRRVYYSRGPGNERTRLKISDSGYLRPFESGLLLRLGFQNIALTTSLRFSDYFTSESGTGDLPLISIGIEIGALPF
ncbi:MAG: hypothetical protein IH599_00115, partial [Bacteroidales bacterium]|nr:hypothetical protein [Bacteroidales bacterium]